MSDLPRITDALVRCYLCEVDAPVMDMTMTDDELWECDDTEGCEARQKPAPTRANRGKIDLTFDAPEGASHTRPGPPTG